MSDKTSVRISWNVMTGSWLISVGRIEVTADNFWAWKQPGMALVIFRNGLDNNGNPVYWVKEDPHISRYSHEEGFQAAWQSIQIVGKTILVDDQPYKYQ